MRTRLYTTLLLLLLVTSVAAQQRGELTGKVTDETGALIPGATVTIEDGAQRHTTVTNDKGEFVFRFLVAGDYDVRVELTGFRTEISKVTIVANQKHTLNITLRVGAPTETVTVISSPPQLSAWTASTGGHTFGAADALGYRRFARPKDRAEYDHIEDNPFQRVKDAARSTFSIDVDTASYANVRRFINDGEMPPAGAVRIEELINYFRFDYPQPSADAPFSVTTELAPCPWNAKHSLALIGLQGRTVPQTSLPARNLVFLVDVSGSMNAPHKLPLVQQSLRMLADRLTARDRVAIVVYAGASGLALPSTPGDQTPVIARAIENLEAGGSTNGGEGIKLAYDIARKHFIDGGVNRVMLATDGDFNVGITSRDALVRLIEKQRESGVYLSVLGFGTEDLQDSTMEWLADKGNGNYSYIDSLQEARKVLVREVDSTVVTIAEDVKIQIEFNPRTVAAYRLIGYENRLLAAADFNDDKKDAGEIGAGHSVTALYEIVPAGAAADDEALGRPAVDPLKYQKATTESAAAKSDEIATIKLRYKNPGGGKSKLLTTVVAGQPRPLGANLGFASAIAEFGMLLRESKHVGNGSFAAAIERARAFRGADGEGDRVGFVALAELAAQLKRTDRTSASR